MSKSPGHQKWPEHKVEERHLNQQVKTVIKDETIATSNDVIEVDEDKHPKHYYFPRSDVDMNKLERSATTSECPFKGSATYYHLKLDGKMLEDAVWTYEEPYDEHRALAGRLAFYEEKYPEIHVELRG